MVRKDGAETRRQRIQEVAVTVQKALNQHNPLSLSKTLAALQYTSGLTKEEQLEYLSIMEANSQFVIDHEKDQIRREASTE